MTHEESTRSDDQTISNSSNSLSKALAQLEISKSKLGEDLADVTVLDKHLDNIRESVYFQAKTINNLRKEIVRLLKLLRKTEDTFADQCSSHIDALETLKDKDDFPRYEQAPRSANG